MSVPRGTVSARSARISVRVPDSLKVDVRNLVDGLQARGLRTTESELVEFFVAEGVGHDAEVLDERLRAWRANGGGER